MNEEGSRSSVVHEMQDSGERTTCGIELAKVVEAGQVWAWSLEVPIRRA